MNLPSVALDAAETAQAAYPVVPLGLILGVMQVESGFDPGAAGDAGCSWGLIQLNTCGGAGSGYTPEQLRDPTANALAGTGYLAGLYQTLGDWSAAISAYNQGLGSYLENGISNRGYVDAVLDAWQEIDGGVVVVDPDGDDGDDVGDGVTGRQGDGAWVLVGLGVLIALGGG